MKKKLALAIATAGIILICSLYISFNKPAGYKKYYIPKLKASFYLDDVPDSIKVQLKRGFYWESGIGKLIAANIRKGSTVVDIGAHIGIHTVRMSRTTGPEGKVIAFEPQVKMYKELLQNLKLNHVKNAVPIRKALGDTVQTIQLNPRNLYNEGGTAIGGGGDEAEMILLDQLELDNVSLIKIDVERYEYFVFKGAEETIRRNKPVLIFEVMGEYDYNNCSDEIREKFDEVLSLVKSFGYRVELIFGNDYIAFPI